MPLTVQQTSDREMLLGLLALQLGFVDRDCLLAAARTCLENRSRHLADVLQEAQLISPQRRQVLESLVEEHLAQHRQDLQASLAALSVLDAAEDLLQLANADLRQNPDNELCDPDPHQTLISGPPERTHRYSVLRPLGQGGLGVVWVARDAELNREVALKEIQPKLATDDESRLRFAREAEITGGLEHPGIVPVYGLGAYPDGRLFYAMRLIKGESLRAAIGRFHVDERGRNCEARAIALRKLLRPFIDACNAVGYAHSRGVLHRDLKPDNIMLGRFGETLVVDWGLAKAAVPTNEQAFVQTEDSAALVDMSGLPEGPLRLSGSASSSATQMGSMLGTPQFMSPEQAEGRLDLISPASDTYSLGVTLYCILTGQTPFAGLDTPQTLERVRRGEFPRPRQLRRDVPTPLEAICTKAMSLLPRDRYATTTELADDLEQWLGDEPVSAYEEPWRQRLGRWSRRHRHWTLAGTIALLLVAFIATVAAIVVGQAWKTETWALAEVSRHLSVQQQEHRIAVEARREAESARQATEQAQSELARHITQLGLEEQLRRSVQSKPLLWEIAADRIEPLHARLRVPTPKDLSMQTWQAYRAARTQRLAGRTTICLLQMGPLTEAQRELTQAVAEFLPCFFVMPVRWLDAAPPSCLKDPREIERTLAETRPPDAVAVLAFMGRACRDGLIREHTTPDGVVLSLGAMGQTAAEGEARARVLRRLLKASTHAVGEALGIRDFAAYHCGMNAAEIVSDLDAKPLAFCPECEQKIWWLADAEPLERYKRLVDFAVQHQLQPELLHWQRSLDAVRQPRP